MVLKHIHVKIEDIYFDSCHSSPWPYIDFRILCWNVVISWSANSGIHFMIPSQNVEENELTLIKFDSIISGLNLKKNDIQHFILIKKHRRK